jgi:hypothetical protein
MMMALMMTVSKVSAGMPPSRMLKEMRDGTPERNTPGAGPMEPHNAGVMRNDFRRPFS